jgi:hypothetical protein
MGRHSRLRPSSRVQSAHQKGRSGLCYVIRQIGGLAQRKGRPGGTAEVEKKRLLRATFLHVEFLIWVEFQRIIHFASWVPLGGVFTAFLFVVNHV